MNAPHPAMTDLSNALRHVDPARAAAVSENEKTLLRVALSAFARQGYGATSARKVALDAGLTAPMVNYYFGSKKQLFRHIGELIFGALVAEVLASVEGDAPLESQVRSFVGAHLRFGAQNPVAIEFICMVLYGPIEGHRILDAYALHRPLVEHSQKFVEKALTDGVIAPPEGVDVDYMLGRIHDVIRNVWLAQVRTRRRRRVSGTRPEVAAEPGRRDVELDIQFLLKDMGHRDA
jgi:AcrR family transcriptional regulator